jgi:hypothetical protein
VDQIKLLPHPPTVIVIDGVALWTFNTQLYENMGANFQTFLKVIKQQRALIEAYQQCVK